MSLLTVVQLLVLLLPAENGTEVLLPVAVSLLASPQFLLQLHLLMLHPTVNLQVLSLVGAELVQAHVFHVLKLLLQLHQRDRTEDRMVLIIKLLHCQSESNHLLVRFLLPHLVNQPFVLELELLEKMLDVEFLFQQYLIELAVFLFDLLILHDLPIDHLLDLLIELMIDELLQLHIGLVINLLLFMDEF